jgi:hypothetical protein
MLKSSAKIPKTIKVEVVSAHRWTEAVTDIFAEVLADYRKRFDAKLKRGSSTVSIALVDYANNEMDGEVGVTNYINNGDIFVQVHDPYLVEGIEEHPYITNAFLATLCHELVHVCQALTTRGKMLDDYDINLSDDPLVWMQIKDNDMDYYYFDPCEIEARIMQDYYTHAYAVPRMRQLKES